MALKAFPGAYGRSEMRTAMNENKTLTNECTACSKVCTIMTSNPQPILDFIIKEMNRSATVEKAYGAYTHHELSVLVTVLTRRQALQLRNFLRENDPRSFITIVNSSEIIGKGFRSFN